MKALYGGTPGVHVSDVPLKGDAFGVLHMGCGKFKLLGRERLSESVHVPRVQTNPWQRRKVRKLFGNLRKEALSLTNSFTTKQGYLAGGGGGEEWQSKACISTAAILTPLSPLPM